MLRNLVFIVLFLFSIALCGDLLTVLARGAHASDHSYESRHFRTYKTHPISPAPLRIGPSGGRHRVRKEGP